jgi:hypothetical protein
MLTTARTVSSAFTELVGEFHIEDVQDGTGRCGWRGPMRSGRPMTHPGATQWPADSSDRRAGRGHRDGSMSAARRPSC